MKEELKKIRELLIIVDMVNGFVREGNMASPNIEHIIPEIEKLANDFSNDVFKKVAFVKDTHEIGAREFDRYPQHCVKNTNEAQNVDELRKYEKMALNYEKNSTCAIFNKELLDDINKMRNLKKVVIVGCCTDICVMNLAIPLQCYFDENDYDVEIVVPRNAVETYDAPIHNAEEWNHMAFKFMDQAGIKLVKKYGGR